MSKNYEDPEWEPKSISSKVIKAVASWPTRANVRRKLCEVRASPYNSLRMSVGVVQCQVPYSGARFTGSTGWPSTLDCQQKQLTLQSCRRRAKKNTVLKIWIPYKSQIISSPLNRFTGQLVSNVGRSDLYIIGKRLSGAQNVTNLQDIYCIGILLIKVGKKKISTKLTTRKIVIVVQMYTNNVCRKKTLPIA